MSNKPKVIMLLDNHYGPDFRVEKEALRLLDLKWDVDIYAVENDQYAKEEERDGYRVFRQIPLDINHPFSKAYRDFKKKFISTLCEQHFDVLHCHDFKMFLLGAAVSKKMIDLGKKITLIYDSHEYLSGYPLYQSLEKTSDRLKGRLVWNWFVSQEKKFLPNADYVISVSESICNELNHRFKLKNPAVLIRNIPKTQSVEISGKKYFHDKFGLDKKSKLIIHTGNAFFSTERLKMLIKLVQKHANVKIVFLGSRKSIDRFKPVVKKLKVEDKIFFHDHVAKDEVTKYCSMADIGLVYVWKPHWTSYWYSFPNKLFDVSLAGLPCLATAQPEFIKFNSEHGHMVTFEGNSYEALEAAYLSLLKNYDQLKQNAAKIRSNISWELEAEKLDRIYLGLKHD